MVVQCTAMLALAETDTLMLASASAAAATDVARHAAPFTPTSPSVSNAAMVLPAAFLMGSFSAIVRLTASPKSLMCASSAAASLASPTTNTSAAGGGQLTLACACAWQSA